ncbi:MAG: hypothetical protein ACYC27_14810 [Armatimonadota bacterium]
MGKVLIACLAVILGILWIMLAPGWIARICRISRKIDYRGRDGWGL